jgi:hypothetical protein
MIQGVDDAPSLFLSSFAQRRLWLLAAQQEGVNEAYHLPFCLRLDGVLDQGALTRALDELVERHESLRTSFCFVDGEVYQRIAASDCGCRLSREDWSAEASWERALQKRIQQEYTTPFDLAEGPLIRSSLIRLSDEEHLLLVTMHHIVSDGWSISIFMREFNALYRAYALGQPAELEPLPIQYADYAEWQRRWLSAEELARQGEYWQRKLTGAPLLLELPTDRPRPQIQDFSGADVPVVLDEALTRGLRALSQRHGLTLFMTLLAGWGLVLSRLSNQREVVIGAPSANRHRQEIEGLIGFFVNMLALRVDLTGSVSVRQLLERVRDTVLEAREHEALPFEQVVELLKPVRSLNHTPIFQATLAWQGFERPAFDLPRLQVRGLRGGGRSPAKFDVALALGEHQGRIIGSLNYATALFDESTARRFVEYLREALTQMVANPDQLVSTVDLLPASERQKLLV